MPAMNIITTAAAAIVLAGCCGRSYDEPQIAYFNRVLDVPGGPSGSATFALNGTPVVFTEIDDGWGLTNQEDVAFILSTALRGRPISVDHADDRFPTVTFSPTDVTALHDQVYNRCGTELAVLEYIGDELFSHPVTPGVPQLGPK